MPLYNSAEHLPEAIESLLGQTFRDFRIVCTDDGTDEQSAEIINRYQQIDARIDYYRNPERLGLTSNWRRCVEVALSRYPDAELFAWVSDHDHWHLLWLETLVAAIDRDPNVVGVFARSAVMGDGRTLNPRSATPSLSHVGLYTTRLRLISRRLRAGHSIYGLFRMDTVRRAGIFRDVLYADRLFLTEASLYGSVEQVDAILYYKRPTGAFSIDRQRKSCFPNGVPLYARLPWWLQHARVLALELGIRGAGMPRVSRGAGMRVALLSGIYNGRMVADGHWRWYRKDRANRIERLPTHVRKGAAESSCSRLDDLRARTAAEIVSLRRLAGK